ncbi:hypothetical protein IAI10_06710 [Clostridium sp. 19966]|uniref:hypothetical protein n=1 Tax=Clostridium sp. 19966 TaxID=2768166 RepID=UPI0028DE7F35|nr:hypothetical protein [Clostridium sp. 19966]MDT8716343.1 hypothetical protein [Clostridium sp. 19966]
MIILILEMLIIMIFSWAAFNLLKLFVLDKLNVNKWIILICTLLVYILGVIFKTSGFLSIIHLIVTLILVFWFVDITFYNKKTKKKEIKIKPKAKPNRVKKK